jgi:UDPglucose--hexose-1-phosphate uridylyltransferase
MPSPSSNPLLPTKNPSHPTELPAGDYDVAVFENRFPSLFENAGPAEPLAGAEIAPARGRCEVVVFSQDPDVSLGHLPIDHLALIIQIWAERTRAMAAAGLSYILPFENRGAEMGVTLHHPHGQIYGYGFVPRAASEAVAALRNHRDRYGHDLVSRLAQTERALCHRLVAVREEAVALVPPFARFPYETWVIPHRSGADLLSLSNSERNDLAGLLSEVLRRLDGLWNKPMPYLLTVNQAPYDGHEHPEWTLRIEIWPIRRAPDKLKFLAGTELGAGVFASDVLPEAAAEQLRSVRL